MGIWLNSYKFYGEICDNKFVQTMISFYGNSYYLFLLKFPIAVGNFRTKSPHQREMLGIL